MLEPGQGRRRPYRGRARRRAAAAGIVVLSFVVAVFVVRHEASKRGYRSSHGTTIVHYTLSSKLLGRRLAEVAVIPPGGGKRPLLILLHGRHDHHASLDWLVPERSGPESMLNDALLAALASLGPRAPVLVLLNGGGHSYFHDRRDGPWASMILDEAIPDAVSRFHTVPGKLAIGGISMGGYGALHLASLQPKRFCAVGGHSAALWRTGGASAPGAFDDAADFARNSVATAAAEGRFDRLAVWLDVGSRDPFRAADTTFAAELNQRGVHVQFHVWPGAHEGRYWHAHMRQYMLFYAAALARCATAGS